ncbi:MAG: glutamate--tRNA ligase [Candidatus Korobacteraceae bacterium]
MPRVRFAPSPTGFLHVGSARTFIFNWLYARHHSGTMVLRLDDTDVERNSDASVQSIFDGLRWLGLAWDEEYKQSDRLALHRQLAESIFANDLAYRDFTPAHAGESDRPGTSSANQGAWLFNPGMRDLPRAESDRRAAAGEPYALRFRVPRGHNRILRFDDAVYGAQSKLADEVEDFALLRSDGMPTYHLASCADDANLRISHVIRGQDHLSNTYKHLLIFEALSSATGASAAPQFAHLPLLVAPDGTKLSKRRHGPVVSVTTYRDAGFLPEAFVNFLCLLGWSPKNDRDFLTLPELTAAFTLGGVNRANAVVNFTEADPFDPKVVWLNAEHIRALPVEQLAELLLPVLQAELGCPTSVAISGGGTIAPGTGASQNVTPEKVLQVAPLIRERIRLLRDAVTAADFFFVNQLPPYDCLELIPQKGDAALARTILTEARELLAATPFDLLSLEIALRSAAERLGLKAGPMFQPIRVAVCGRKNAPPLFETMEVLGRELCLERISQAIQKLQDQP